MGRGRNRRRKSKRREAKAQAKAREKKDRASRKASNNPKAQRVKGNKRGRKNRPKRQRGYREMADSLPIAKPKKASFINIAMNASLIIDKSQAERINKLKEWRDKGILTNLVFLTFGKWNNRTRNRLREIYKENGYEWAWNHTIFKFGHEYNKIFINRVIRCWDITHYVDGDKENVREVIMNPHMESLHIFFWDKKIAAWDEFRAFIRKHNPSYFVPFDKHEKASTIIQTGFARDFIYDDFNETVIDESPGMIEMSSNSAVMGMPGKVVADPTEPPDMRW